MRATSFSKLVPFCRRGRGGGSLVARELAKRRTLLAASYLA